MYSPAAYRFPLLPQGLGQAAPCPSAEQLQGVVDINDPCQNASLNPTIGASMITPTGFQTFFPATGTYVASTATGQALPAVGTGNWIVLAAVLGGLFLFAAVVK